MGILDTIGDGIDTLGGGIRSVGNSAYDFASDKADQLKNIAVSTAKEIGEDVKGGATRVVAGVGTVANDAKDFAKDIGNKVQQTLGDGFQIAQDILNNPEQIIETVIHDVEGGVASGFQIAQSTLDQLKDEAEQEIAFVASTAIGVGTGLFAGMVSNFRSIASSTFQGIYQEAESALELASQATVFARSQVGPAKNVAESILAFAVLKAKIVLHGAVDRAAARAKMDVDRIAANVMAKTIGAFTFINSRVIHAAQRVTNLSTAAITTFTGAIDLATGTINKMLGVMSAVLPSGIQARIESTVKGFEAKVAKVRQFAVDLGNRIQSLTNMVSSTIQNVTGIAQSILLLGEVIGQQFIKGEIDAADEFTKQRIDILLGRIANRISSRLNEILGRVDGLLLNAFTRISSLMAGITSAYQSSWNPIEIIFGGLGTVVAQVAETAIDIGRQVDARFSMAGGIEKAIGDMLGHNQKAVHDPGKHLAPTAEKAKGILKKPAHVAAKAGQSLGNLIMDGISGMLQIGSNVIHMVGDLLGHPIDRTLQGIVDIVGKVKKPVEKGIDFGISTATGIVKGVAQTVGRIVTGILTPPSISDMLKHLPGMNPIPGKPGAPGKFGPGATGPGKFGPMIGGGVPQLPVGFPRPGGKFGPTLPKPGAGKFGPIIGGGLNPFPSGFPQVPGGKFGPMIGGGLNPFPGGFPHPGGGKFGPIIGGGFNPFPGGLPQMPGGKFGPLIGGGFNPFPGGFPRPGGKFGPIIGGGFNPFPGGFPQMPGGKFGPLTGGGLSPFPRGFPQPGGKFGPMIGGGFKPFPGGFPFGRPGGKFGPMNPFPGGFPQPGGGKFGPLIGGGFNPFPGGFPQVPGGKFGPAFPKPGSSKFGPMPSIPVAAPSPGGKFGPTAPATSPGKFGPAIGGGLKPNFPQVPNPIGLMPLVGGLAPGIIPTLVPGAKPKPTSGNGAAAGASPMAPHLPIGIPSVPGIPSPTKIIGGLANLAGSAVGTMFGISPIGGLASTVGSILGAANKPSDAKDKKAINPLPSPVPIPYPNVGESPMPSFGGFGNMPSVLGGVGQAVGSVVGSAIGAVSELPGMAGPMAGLGSALGGLAGGFAPFMGPSTLGIPDIAKAIQKKGSLNKETVDPASLKQLLSMAGSAGSPVPAESLRVFGDTSSGDAGEARVHADPSASAAAREMGARAFTIGKDIYFGPGAYEPHTREGQALIGHELTHVVQQTGGRVDAAQFDTKHGGDALEQEAQQTERRILLGLGTPNVFHVDSYARTYKAERLTQHEQARLDDLSQRALKECGNRLKHAGAPKVDIESLDVELDVDLDQTDEEIISGWASAILDAVTAYRHGMESGPIQDVTMNKQRSANRAYDQMNRYIQQSFMGIPTSKTEVLEDLGVIKGAVLQVTGLADTLLWADWMSAHSGDQAAKWTHRALSFFGVKTSAETDKEITQAGDWVTKAFNSVMKTLPPPMNVVGSVHRFLDENPGITKYLKQAGLVNEDGMFQISQGFSGEYDKMAHWIAEKMGENIDDRSSTGGLLSPYEMGEIAGALGIQIAMIWGPEEASVAAKLLQAIGTIGATRGLLDQIDNVYKKNPNPSASDFATPEIFVAVMNFFAAVVGLAAASSWKRLVQILVAVAMTAALGADVAIFCDIVGKWNKEQDPTKKEALRKQMMTQAQKVIQELLMAIKMVLEQSSQAQQAHDAQNIETESNNKPPAKPDAPPPPPDPALPQAGTDPNKPPVVDPNAPPVVPADPNAPPKPPQQNGPPAHDPNAPPSDPNVTPPTDPNVTPTDPNAPKPVDPNAPTDPNAPPTDPNKPTDPNAPKPGGPEPIPADVHEQIRSKSWDELINEARSKPDSIPPERQQALDAARNQMIKNSIPDVPGIIADDPGSIGFTSDHDITFRPKTPPKTPQEAAQAITDAQAATDQFMKNLREQLGGQDPEIHLKTNAKAYQGHDVELPVDLPADQAAAAKLVEDAGGLAAIMRAKIRSGDPAAWEAYKSELLERTNVGENAGPAEQAMAKQLREQLSAQIASAEQMFEQSNAKIQVAKDKLRAAGRPEEVLELEARQAVSKELLTELAAELNKGAGTNWARVRELQAMANIIDPEGYVTNAAMKSVVDSGQAIKKDPKKFIDPNDPSNQRPIYDDPRTVAATSADNLGQFTAHVGHEPATVGEAVSQLDLLVKYTARISGKGQKVPGLDEGLLYERKAGESYSDALQDMVSRDYGGAPFTPELAHQFVLEKLAVLERFVQEQQVRAASLADPLPSTPAQPNTPAPAQPAGPPSPNDQPLPPPPPPSGPPPSDPAPPTDPSPPPPPSSAEPDGPPTVPGSPPVILDPPGQVVRHADAPGSATVGSPEQYAVREMEGEPPLPGQDDTREAKYFVNAQLDTNGILEIDVRTAAEDGVHRSSQLKGRDLYNEVFDHFGSRIQGVNSDYTGTNLQVFNERMANASITFEEAAMQTPSGRLLTEHGLRPVDVEVSPNPPGPYESVKVKWRR